MTTISAIPPTTYLSGLAITDSNRTNLWSQLSDADKLAFLTANPSTTTGTGGGTTTNTGGSGTTGTGTTGTGTTTGTTGAGTGGATTRSTATPPPTYLSGVNITEANRTNLWSQLSDADKARFLTPTTTYTPPASGSTAVDAQTGGSGTAGSGTAGSGATGGTSGTGTSGTGTTGGSTGGGTTTPPATGSNGPRGHAYGRLLHLGLHLGQLLAHIHDNLHDHGNGGRAPGRGEHNSRHHETAGAAGSAAAAWLQAIANDAYARAQQHAAPGVHNSGHREHDGHGSGWGRRRAGFSANA